MLPTYIAERYIPFSDAVTPDDRSTDSVLHPRESESANYGLKFRAEIKMPDFLKSITSPTHAINGKIFIRFNKRGAFFSARFSAAYFFSIRFRTR
jgi:hypothetical protein